MGEAVVMAVEGAEAIMEDIQAILALDVEAVIKTTEEVAEEDTTDMETTRPLLTGEGADLDTMRLLLQDSSPGPRPLMAMEAIRDSVAGATEEAMGPLGMAEAGGTLTMVTSSLRGQAGEGRRGRRGHAALSLASTNTNLIRERSQRPEARRRRRQRRPRRLCLRRRTCLRSIWSRTLGRIRVK